MIGRFEGTDGFAHKRKVTSEWTDGKDKRLFWIIPRSVMMAILVE
jgi:hypothetical protein